MPTSREIREWAAANDVDCPASYIPDRVRDAYLAARDAPSPEPAVPADGSEYVDDPDGPTVTVDLPGAREHELEVAEALLAVVQAAWNAGRAAERAAMVTHLTAEL